MGTASAFARITVAALALAGCAHPPQGADRGPLADDSAGSVAAAVAAVTTFPDRLDQRIWDRQAMKPDVRRQSLALVERVVRESGIPGLTVDAVELFGSNASYEYDDASDFGLHVFTHSPTLNAADLGKVLRLLNDDVERRQEGRIRFRGVPVEVTFHAERTANYGRSPGIGQYSLTDGRWIELPVRQPDNFDRSRMTADLDGFVSRYNDLVTEFEAHRSSFDCSRFGDLDDAMKAYRDSGFAEGLGSRSTQNLTYRAARRLNVSIPEQLDRLADDCIFAQESIG